MASIIVKGAREHNLKNIDVEIPRGQLVVLTGLSGSGKSSLAFDTLYAEGQRRYVESLSAYARQFLAQMPKPDVDAIDGLSPAISIEQRSTSRNPRSTVGTVTEVYDYLRLLYARIGDVYCYGCNRRIAAQTVEQMVDQILSLPEGTRFSVLAPVVRGRKGEHRRELDKLRRDGFVRANIDGELYDLEEAPALDAGRQHTIEVYVDRLVMKPGVRRRLTDSVELCIKLADGLVKVAPLEGQDLLFSEKFACIECGISYPEISPRFFSFNNPHGACPECDGIGARLFFDPDLIVPNPKLSLREGAIEPWERRNPQHFQQTLDRMATRHGIDLYTPWSELSHEHRHLVLYGPGKTGGSGRRDRNGRGSKGDVDGVIGNLERRLSEYERRRREEGAASLESLEAAYDEYHRYMSTSPCDACGGTRLRREARHVRVGGRSIDEVVGLPLDDAHAFIRDLELTRRQQAVGTRVLREVEDRLAFLCSVGLGYLTLNRPAATLSGGEGQRIRLATQIGSSLTGVLYILDEPSIGLHQRDNTRLLATLQRLRDLGNTVLVVEHDEETIRAADYVIDMGPRAGIHGGEVVAAGTPAEISAAADSLTGAYLAGSRFIEVPTSRRQVKNRWITVKGACANNLKKVDVRFPSGVLCAVTGVSGSGKSTLVLDTLLRSLQAHLRGAKGIPGLHDGLEGLHLVDKVIDIDQSPIGRTPRSNPATYSGVLTHVRDLFAQLPDSKARGYKPGRYSFNVKGGRCESCQGDGILRIEMHFLPDLYVECEDCHGRRYNRETLEVRYKGMSIADVLEMTVSQACEFLEHIPKARQKLETLRAVGLGYLTLGLSATTLSGGEAQRVKLSRELAKKSTGRTLYVLDEPTTGLHFEDIRQLLEVLNRLVDAGNTVVVIEHNLEVIKSADWVIDLGPEGGDGGGRVVAQGTPEDIARVSASHTGAALRRVLARSPRVRADGARSPRVRADGRRWQRGT